jgi:ABC-type nitrate/sulfonate/bicarbonate transport system substrate-binding protein
VSTAMIIARTHGSRIRIVAASTLSTKEHPLFRYLVKDGSPVGTRPSDFVGRKVVASPTTITWYPLVVWLKRGGVDPEKVEFVTMPSPLATEQALRDGKVDVIGATETSPPGSKMLAEGGVHFLPGLSDFDVLDIPQIGGWAMREEFIEAHPDVVRRFVLALQEGYRWSNAHPDSAQAILNHRNEVPKEYEKFQKKWRPVVEDALVDSGSIRKWVSILEEFGQIPKGSVRPQDVYTNAFVPAGGH